MTICTRNGTHMAWWWLWNAASIRWRSPFFLPGSNSIQQQVFSFSMLVTNRRCKLYDKINFSVSTSTLPLLQIFSQQLKLKSFKTALITWRVQCHWTYIWGLAEEWKLEMPLRKHCGLCDDWRCIKPKNYKWYSTWIMQLDLPIMKL